MISYLSNATHLPHNRGWCPQVSRVRGWKGFDGEAGRVRANALSSKGLPTSSARTTTIATELADGDPTDVQNPADKAKFFSKVAPALAINSRRLQDSACADGAASIFVSSTVFPLMEGCFLANVVDGNTVYAADTATIVSVESTSTAEVSASLYLVIGVFSWYPQCYARTLNV